MFTLNQINVVHARVKSGADFPQYVQDIKRLGVVAYDHYVTDGRNEYFGPNAFTLTSEPVGAPLTVADTGAADALTHALKIHQQGQTDYPTFCRQAAEAGVEKWTTHAHDLTCTYYDKHGRALVTETIPRP